MFMSKCQPSTLPTQHAYLGLNHPDTLLPQLRRRAEYVHGVVVAYLLQQAIQNHKRAGPTDARTGGHNMS